MVRKKFLACLIILGSGCAAVFGQSQTNCELGRPCPNPLGYTRAGCEAQLHHFTVHDYSPILTGQLFSKYSEEWKPIYTKLPTRLLFSENGIEIYAYIPSASAIDDTMCKGCGRDFLGNVASGLGVIAVYQSEAARQMTIKQLRDGYHLLPPPGMGASPDNLKYAKVIFAPDVLIEGNPLAEKWHIAYMEFDQPDQCQNVFQNDVHHTLWDAYKHSVDQVAYTNDTKDAEIDITHLPLWTKALHAMLSWVEECSLVMDK